MNKHLKRQRRKQTGRFQLREIVALSFLIFTLHGAVARADIQHIANGFLFTNAQGSVLISDTNGSILSITTGGGSIASGGEAGLWSVSYVTNGSSEKTGSLNAASFSASSPSNTFQWTLAPSSNLLYLTYSNAALTVVVTLSNRADGVDLSAALSPRLQNVLSLTLPAPLRFDPSGLQRFIAPSHSSDGVGMAYNQTYFQAQSEDSPASWKNSTVGPSGYISLYGGPCVYTNYDSVPISFTTNGVAWLGASLSNKWASANAVVHRPPAAGQADVVLLDSPNGAFLSGSHLGGTGLLMRIGGLVDATDVPFSLDVVIATIEHLSQTASGRTKVALFSLVRGPVIGKTWPSEVRGDEWRDRLLGSGVLASNGISLAELSTMPEITAALTATNYLAILNPYGELVPADLAGGVPSTVTNIGNYVRAGGNWFEVGGYPFYQALQPELYYTNNLLYPPAFADFYQMETTNGNASFYSVQPVPSDPWAGQTNLANLFIPGHLVWGGDATGGWFQRAFGTYVATNQTWQSPVVRLSLGQTASDALHAYAQANDFSRSLTNKMTPALLDQFRQSVMIRYGGVCTQLTAHLSQLPTPAVLHFEQYLYAGFDKQYPDHLPPSTNFGTSSEFTNFLGQARQSGRLAMPYTNPTFWGDNPRSAIFTNDDPLQRNLDGSVSYEEYFGNGGFNITPWHPTVQAANRNTRGQFITNYPVDILFQDQVGARTWQYDISTSSPSPYAYASGLAAIAAEDSQFIPVSTENLWDRLINAEAQSCGLAWGLAPTTNAPVWRRYLRDRYAPSTWQVFPLAQYLAHDKLSMIYNDLNAAVHNHEVMAWTLGLGYSMTFVVNATDLDTVSTRQWLLWIDRVQKSVAARYIGQPVTTFSHQWGTNTVNPDNGVIAASYGPVSVVGNLGPEQMVTNGWTLPGYGYIATATGLVAANILPPGGSNAAPYVAETNSSGGVDFWIYSRGNTNATIVLPAGLNGQATVQVETNLAVQTQIADNVLTVALGSAPTATNAYLWHGTAQLNTHASYLIDFGPNDVTNGDSTPSPDFLGQYWNNFVGAGGGGGLPALALANLTNVNGGTSTIGLTSSASGWAANGKLNGGLLAPSYSLLGSFAVTNATEDYFLTTTTASLAITNLDATANYRLSYFGTRSTTVSRVTRYVTTGGNGSFTNDLTTSGTGVGSGGYNGNNNTNTTVSGITPNGSGQIQITVTTNGGGFAYLGILEITANRSPTANNDTFIRAAGTTLSITNTQLMANDTDPDGDALTFGGFGLLPAGATTNDSVINLPADTGTVSFTYTLLDSYGGSATGTATVHSLSGNPASASASTNPISSGASTMLSLAGGGGGSGETVAWYTESCGGTLIGTGNGLTVNPSHTTMYYGRYEQPYGTSACVSVTVTVFGKPTLLVYGSSVALGYGTGVSSFTNGSYLLGYAGWLTTQLEPTGWFTTNKSVGGNSTTSALARFQTDAVPIDPDLILIGLSLGNEGLATSPDSDAAYESYRSGMTNLIHQSRTNGFYPAATLNYPNNFYTSDDYGYVKRMNLLMNTWDLPSVNILGAVDDGQGKWAAGFWSDNAHPNAAGHEEMFYAIVPSLFDAILAGKTNSPSLAGTYGFAHLQGDAAQPLTFTPSNTMHSFNAAFRVRSGYTGTVAAVVTSTGSPPSAPAIFLVDFGRHDGTNGNATASPDVNGNYWNNLSSRIDSAVTNGTKIANMISTSNGTSSIGLEITNAGWTANGILNGGLTNPSPALLGDFAIATATQDYFFTPTNASFKLTGLNSGKTYTLRFFGSRLDTVNRLTTYSVGTNSVELLVGGPTSGISATNRNDHATVSLSGLIPDINGEITVTISNKAGANAHLNIMEITEVTLESSAQAGTIEIRDNQLAYVAANGQEIAAPVDANDGSWYEVALSYSHVRGVTLLYVDGVQCGTLTNSAVPLQFVLGGQGLVTGRPPAPAEFDLQDWCIYRAPWTPDEAMAQHLGNLQQASMEIGAPLDDAAFANGDSASNRAQSLSRPMVNATNITPGAVVTPPGNLQATAIATNTVQLAWVDNSATETGYVVERRLADASAFWSNLVSLAIGATGYTDTGVPAGTYEYRVSPQEGSLQGDYSGIASVLVSNAPAYWAPASRSILVDFGNNSSYNGASVANPDVNGRYWNSVWSGAFYANMVDVSNQTTTVDLGFDYAAGTDNFNGPAGAVDAAALGMLGGATNAVNDYYISSRFRILGLDTARVYRLTFFGSHKYSADTTTVYSVYADTNYSELVASSSLNVLVPGSPSKHNSNTVAVITNIAPQANQALYVKFQGINGSNGYLNAMMIEEVAATNAPAVATTQEVFLVDFGRHDGVNGNATVSPDANGAYWNNISGRSSDGAVTSGTKTVNMVTTTNGSSSVGIEVTSGTFLSNGRNNGGLFQPYGPTNALLGELAVETATEDYFFTSGTDSFKLTGLNPNRNYNLFFFGSRSDSTERVTSYAVGFTSVTLRTSGPLSSADAAGTNRNNHALALLAKLSPDASGDLTVSVTKVSGSFAHLNLMKIEEVILPPTTNSGPGILTSPSSLSFICTNGAGALPTQSFGLTNVGKETLNFTLATNAYWLSASPVSGSLAPGAGQQITVAVNASGLDTGVSNAVITFSDPAATNSPLTVGVSLLVKSAAPTLAIFGSSVAKGWNSSGNISGVQTNGSWTNGYTYFITTYLTQNGGYYVTNSSVPGENTATAISRFSTAIVPTEPNYVLIAYSLGNEGFAGTSDPTSSSIVSNFSANLQTLIGQCRSNGFYPVLSSVYPRGNYTLSNYAYLKQMHVAINAWDVPSLNLLGPLDDGSGKWQSGYWSDEAHPNDAGYLEFYHAFVPSLFAAIASGKTNSPQFSSVTNFARLASAPGVYSPLTFTPSNTVHGFTTAFRMRTFHTGTLAAVRSGSNFATLEMRSNQLVHISADGQETVVGPALNDGTWHEVAWASGYARSNLIIFVDGAQTGTTADRIAPDQFILGGPGASARAASPALLDLQRWFVYRAPWTVDEAQANYLGNLQQSSMEIGAMLDDASFSYSTPVVNLAQSLSEVVVATSNLIATQDFSIPAAVTAQSSTGRSATVSWSWSGSGQSGFIIQRRLAGASSWSDFATVGAGATNFTDTGLAWDAIYEYRLAAGDEAGLRGAYSSVATLLMVNASHPRFLVDFGPNDVTNGVITSSPDFLGQHWNNLVGTAGGSANSITLNSLTRSDGVGGGPGLFSGPSGWSCNGKLNGALLAPRVGLLGNLAVTNATSDYFFTGGTSTLTVTNLDTSANYRLRLFGSRIQASGTNDHRVTRFVAIGQNGSFSNDLQTTGYAIGADGYNGNNSNIVLLAGLVPDPAKQIQIEVSSVGSNVNAYINLMEILLNHAPVATNETFSRNAGQELTISSAQLTANDADPDGDPLYFAGFADLPTGATTNDTSITLPASGSAVSFTYSIRDDLGGLATASVSVEITPPPAAPVIGSFAREGNDIRVSWTGQGGATHRVQVLQAGASGSFSGEFSDLGTPITLQGAGEVATNYLDQGGVSNGIGRYYRVTAEN